MNINTIALVGNLGRDPEFKSFQTGTEIMEARFCFTTRKKKDGEWGDHHNWIDLVWFKPPHALKPYLVKGRGLAIAGHLEIDTWKDKTTGQGRSKPVIVVDQVQLCTMRGEESQVPLTPTTMPADEPGKADGYAPDSAPF